MELGDVTKPGRKDYTFLVNCNAPFSYRVEAQYGALTSTNAEKGSGSFVAALPYDVAVRIPTDGTPIEDRCPGESIKSGRVTCPFSNSGNNIAIEFRSPAGADMALAGEGRRRRKLYRSAYHQCGRLALG